MGKVLYLSQELFDKFMERIPTLKTKKMTHKHIRLMFKVLLSGAMRINELLQLTPEDILPNGKLRLKWTKTGWKKCPCSVWEKRKLKTVDYNCDKCKGTGKIRIDQYVWLTKGVFAELEEFVTGMPKNQRIFPVSDRQVLNYVNDLIGGRTHTFRHTKLTWMLEQGNMNIRDIKSKARHSSLQVTSQYIEDNTDLTQKKENEVMDI